MRLTVSEAQERFKVHPLRCRGYYGCNGMREFEKSETSFENERPLHRLSSNCATLSFQ